jgi:hypothetical protein
MWMLKLADRLLRLLSSGKRDLLICVTTVICASAVHAVCPFNVDQSSAANSTRATTDGLLFLRYALGLPATTPPITSATENASLTSTQVGTFIDTNKTALDIDGDTKFTIFDAQIIARYLFGFRGERLSDGLTPFDFGARYGGMALQTYIDNGCTGTNDAADPRIAAWNAMNAQLALGTTAGIDAAKAYLTDTGIDNLVPVFVALRTELSAIIASYSQIIPRTVSSEFAEYWVSRPLPGSTTGEREIFTITFLRMFDGSWRVDTM